jgi:hypothetical protein
LNDRVVGRQQRERPRSDRRYGVEIDELHVPQEAELLDFTFRPHDKLRLNRDAEEVGPRDSIDRHHTGDRVEDDVGCVSWSCRRGDEGDCSEE